VFHIHYVYVYFVFVCQKSILCYDQITIKLLIMATYTDGINGNFRGKVGTVIGSSWKGRAYIKSLHHPRTIPPRKLEQQNRNKFSMAHHWLKDEGVKEFVRAGFKGYSSTVEGFLAAKSCLLKNAFTGEGEEMGIDPALAQVSYGPLPLPANITAAKIVPDEVEISWDAVNKNDEGACDQVMILAYDIENGVATSNVTGQFRYVGRDTIRISPGRPERTYHIYAAFVAADRSCQSSSVYLGTVNN
jgi:hypothetical protein